MKITILENVSELGKAAGTHAAQLIRKQIEAKGSANIILATGTSQFEIINQVIREKNIEWNKVVMFHLDEYIGLREEHPASFRRYLRERFLSKLPPLKATYLINGETDPQQECDRLGDIIARHPIDVALAGIGENGHLAFNDPPADFETESPYIVVELDEASRKQQLGEGWFGTLGEVPHQAITMSIKQILKSEYIICSAPDKRKAVAVKNTLEQPVSNRYPASVLRTHENCSLYLDKESAALISGNFVS